MTLTAHSLCLVVALACFLLAAIAAWVPAAGGRGTLLPAGLAFLTLALLLP